MSWNQNRIGLWDLSGLDLRMWVVTREACGDEANCFQMAGDHQGLHYIQYHRIVWTNAITFMWIKKCVWSQIKPTKTPYQGKCCLKTHRSAGFKEACRDMSWLQSRSQMALKTLFQPHILHSVSLPPFPTNRCCISFLQLCCKNTERPNTKDWIWSLRNAAQDAPSHPGYSQRILVPLSFRTSIILTRILILSSSSVPFYFPCFTFWGWYTTSFLNPLPHDRWLHSF